MASSVTALLFLLLSAFVLVTVLVYLLTTKALSVLDGHLERFQSKLDILQLQLQKLIDHVM